VDEGASLALDDHPYMVCSIRELERAVSLMTTRGVAAVVDSKVRTHRRQWHWHSAMLDAFQEEYSSAGNLILFPGALDTILGLNEQE
jgi:hypothetical protein